MTRVAFREALRGLRSGIERSAIVAVSVAVTFSLLGVFLVADRNLSAAVRQARTASKVVAYMKPGAPAAASEEVARTARALSGVSAVRVATPEEALEEFRAALGPKDPIFEALDGNPLPAFVEITPSVEDPTAIAEAIEKIEGVEEVDFGRKTVARLGRIAGALRLVGLAVGAGIFLFSFLLVTATEGLSAFARREEIEVLRLVGADDTTILAPFWIEGAILGGLGSLLGVAADAALFRLLVARFPEAAFRPVFLDPGSLLVLVLAGAAMGAIGGLVAAARLLRAEIH